MGEKIVEEKRNKRGEILLITGASGCLGYHLLKLLISNDRDDDDNNDNLVEEIRCLDLKEPEELMKKLIDEEQEKLKLRKGKAKKIRWFIGDIRDINVVEKVVCVFDNERKMRGGVDCVIHCAAKVDIWKETRDQNVDELKSINVDGTKNLLDAAIKFGCPKFIHVSSFEVFTDYGTLYYATETTLPENKSFLFGSSGSTKKDAENKVKQYSNRKLNQEARNGKDSLNAIIIRFPSIYGEFDKYFISKWLKVTKSMGGELRRLDNIWIRQQPIYAQNAAWSLIKANQRMNHDLTISGEEFHITDDTDIKDPFEFLEPFIEAKGMHLTKRSLPLLPVLLFVYFFLSARRILEALDLFGIFTRKKNRLQEAIERDTMEKSGDYDKKSPQEIEESNQKLCFGAVPPSMLFYLCNTSFLNRTKAALRLDYEPIVDSDKSFADSIDWYKKYLKV